MQQRRAAQGLGEGLRAVAQIDKGALDAPCILINGEELCVGEVRQGLRGEVADVAASIGALP